MKIDRVCRKSIPEGLVLLENDGTLPLKKDDRVAVFGRGQTEYLKGGTGSGGRINCPYVKNISDELKKEVRIDENLSEFYERFIEEHPYDTDAIWSYPERKIEPVFTDEQIENYAKENDKAIFVIGRSAGEGYDCKAEKGDWYLSDEERLTIAQLSRSFKNFAVLINSGNIIDMSWVKELNVKSVMYIWQGGQEGGEGTVDALMGYNPPSGKLTDTIADINKNPSTSHFGNDKENIHYEDIYVGYRYFETFDKSSVYYPFGYGKTYTDFAINEVKVTKRGEKIFVGVTVENTGNFFGKEVVEVYYSCPSGKLGKPARQLIAFKKTKQLKKGERQRISVSFSVRDMASYDESGATGYKSSFVLEKGEYLIFVGNNVRDAKEVFAFDIEKDIQVKQCGRAFPNKFSFDIIKEENGKKLCVKSYADNESVKDHIKPIPAIECDSTEEMSFKDVSCDEDMKKFVSRFSPLELSYLLKGEGMSSIKAPVPGTASVFGGSCNAFLKKGVPVVTCCDGPAGLRFECGIKVTCIPIGTLIACSWCPGSFKNVFKGFAREAVKNKVDIILGPGMNIHRNPLCGRNFEYFSEDPLITGEFAKMISETFTDEGVYATAKHFAVNSQELNRNNENEIVSERALREIYLKGFEIAVKHGKLFSIMTSYNLINGVSAASNYDLTTTVLRDEWGYKGMVMSDWWASADGIIDNSRSCKNIAGMIKAQNDVFMVCPDCEHNTDDVEECIGKGIVTVGELQRNAINVLNLVKKTLANKRPVEINSDAQTFGNETVYKTVVKNGRVKPGVPAGMYFVEFEYSIDGDELQQHTVNFFADKGEALPVIVKGTNGEVKKAGFRMYFEKDTELRIDGNVLSLTVFK